MKWQKDHFGQHLYVRIAFWVWPINPSAVRVKKELTGSPIVQGLLQPGIAVIGQLIASGP